MTTAPVFVPPMCHDRPCSACGHPAHHVIPCDTCGPACVPPPTPGIYP